MLLVHNEPLSCDFLPRASHNPLDENYLVAEEGLDCL
jgi:hypothetical protein